MCTIYAVVRLLYTVLVLQDLLSRAMLFRGGFASFTVKNPSNAEGEC